MLLHQELNIALPASHCQLTGALLNILTAQEYQRLKKTGCAIAGPLSVLCKLQAGETRMEQEVYPHNA
jgi:hypothetical protein